MTLEQKLAKKRKSDTVVTGLSMTQEQYDKLDQMIEYFGVNRSELLRTMLESEHERLVKARKL